jgi:hypothetical protein
MILNIRQNPLIASSYILSLPSGVRFAGFRSASMSSSRVFVIVVSAIIALVIKQYLAVQWSACTLILLVAALFLGSTYKIYIYLNFLSPLRHLPEPRGALPLIGNDLALFQQPPAQDFGRWMREVHNEGLVRLSNA